MIRVYLLDDHGLMRAGYRMILEPQGDIEVVGEASCAEDALPQIRRLKPDVVLCDLHLPGASGLEITERLVRSQVGCRIVMVTVQVEGPMPRRLIEAGATAYLSKGCDAAELLRAIREAHRGRRYLGVDIAQRLALAVSEGSPFDRLSRREMEISLMLCQGLRAEDIARRLSLSGKTVATHKYRMFDKLGIKDTIALARMAAQHGLTEPSLIA
jgi:DNA-binding NarL/FixJ family response regulator